jgi:hypothetical protein
MASEAGAEDSSKSVHTELFVVHPTLSPADISRILQMDAHVSHGVGEPRATPKGKLLGGIWPRTTWRHGVEVPIEDHRFAKHLVEFVANLKLRRSALAELRASGGQTTLVLQFLGNYFGDEIDRELVSEIAELGLSLGIEVFAAPQF